MFFDVFRLNSIHLFVDVLRRYACITQNTKVNLLNNEDKKELDSMLVIYIKETLESMREDIRNSEIDCVTEEEAIEILSISKSTIQRLRKNGELKGKRLGKRYYYTKENLRKAIKPK